MRHKVFPKIQECGCITSLATRTLLMLETKITPSDETSQIKFISLLLSPKRHEFIDAHIFVIVLINSAMCSFIEICSLSSSNG